MIEATELVIEAHEKRQQPLLAIAYVIGTSKLEKRPTWLSALRVLRRRASYKSVNNAYFCKLLNKLMFSR